MKRFFLQMAYGAAWLALGVAFAGLDGCTFAPKPIVASQPSWDASTGQQNSGLVGVVLLDGTELRGAAADAHKGPVRAWIVSPSGVARYNALVIRFGDRLTPRPAILDDVSTRPDGNFLMSNAMIEDFATLVRLSRRTLPSVPSP